MQAARNGKRGKAPHAFWIPRMPGQTLDLKSASLTGVRMDGFSQKFTRLEFPLAGRPALSEFCNSRHVVGKRRELVRESHTPPAACIIHEGWMCTYKRLPDGGRQVINIHLPGDIVGLTSLFLRNSDQSIEALTDTIVSDMDKSQLLSAMRALPALAEDVMWSIARDKAMVAQRLASLGRRNALARTSHFLLELGFRLQEVGKATESGYAFPVSQQLLADTLGLTNIHMNRILRHLRERRLLQFSAGAVEFLNRPALVQLAEFDPSYLS